MTLTKRAITTKPSRQGQNFHWDTWSLSTSQHFNKHCSIHSWKFLNLMKLCSVFRKYWSTLSSRRRLLERNTCRHYSVLSPPPLLHLEDGEGFKKLILIKDYQCPLYCSKDWNMTLFIALTGSLFMLEIAGFQICLGHQNISVCLSDSWTHVGSPGGCQHSGRRSRSDTCRSADPPHWPCNGTDLLPCREKGLCGCRTSLHSGNHLGHSHKLQCRQV